MKRETQNVLLLLVGGALVKITVDGSYLRYLKPVMAPWLLAAGLVIVALALIAIGRDIRDARAAAAEPEQAHDNACGEHHHDSRGPWLLLVPVLAIFLIAPPALGSDTVNRAGSRTVAAPDPAQRALFPPLPPGEVIPMRFVDMVTRAGFDTAGTLNDRLVQITGFVVHKNGRPHLARISISCCAADANPIHAQLAGDTFGQYRDDQWLSVTGTVVPGSATQANGYGPTLAVQSAHPIATPDSPYEY